MFKLAFFLFNCLLMAMAMPGGLVDQDLTNLEVRQKATDLVSSAFMLLESEYNLIEVVRYRSQVVAGTKHYFEVNVQSKSCQEDQDDTQLACQVHRCKINLWEKPWENFLNVTEYECKAKANDLPTTTTPLPVRKWLRTRPTTRRPEFSPSSLIDHRQSMPGSFQRIDLNDSTAQSILFEVTAKLNTEIKEVVADSNYFKTTPLKFYRQVVAGTRYIFVTQFQRSVCAKNDSAVQNLTSSSSQCTADNKSDPYFCRITVFVPLPTSSRQSNETANLTVNATSNSTNNATNSTNSTSTNTTTTSTTTIGTPIQYGNNPTIDIVGGNSTTNGTVSTTTVVVSTTTIVAGNATTVSSNNATTSATTTTQAASATTARPTTAATKFTITERICF